MEITTLRNPRWGARLAGALVLLAGALPASFAVPDDARLPVPDPAARSAAIAELKKELREDLKSKDPEAKRALAKKLVERAAAPEADPVKRYALLEETVSLAVEVRDLRLALDATGQIALAFQAERAALAFAAVDAISRGAKEASVLAESATACVELMGDALAADDPGTAQKAIAAAKTLAKSAKLGGLVARATEVGEFVGAYRRASTAAETARTALATTPDDPAACEALGRFLCFGRGRWDEGLAHLAKSPVAAIAELAARDLSHPEDPAARQAVADGWWDVAQKEKDPLARARMLGRAALAYEAATDADEKRAALLKTRLDAITYRAWNGALALTKDFSRDGPVSLVLAAIRDFIGRQGIDKSAKDWRTRLPRFPDVKFGRGEEYVWRLDTNQGAISLRFFADSAPRHVANFLYLTELGFFDGVSFHRVIPDFMAQGGCPKGDGTGGPGYFIDSEFSADRRHDKAGILSMANTGQPTTDGSQFFITFRPCPELDGKHTVFGEVIDGMDVVKKLEAQGTPDSGRPKTPLVIQTARVSLR